VNGTLSIQKDEIIMGMETIIEFSSLTFGAPDGESFKVGLMVDEIEVRTGTFPHSLGEGSKHQLTWTFLTPGSHNLTIILHGEPYPDVEEMGLLDRISISIEVGFVDLSIDGILAGDKLLSAEDNPMDPGSYQFKAIVSNIGNASANYFSVTMEVIELDQSTNITLFTVNVTDLQPEMNTTVQFKSFRIRPEREYRITVTIDIKDKWLEGSTDNDDLSLIIEVGEEPPIEPPWKESWVPFTGAALAMIISLILFLYLMRKKL
jgi:hypothetical protein